MPEKQSGSNLWATTVLSFELTKALNAGKWHNGSKQDDNHKISSTIAIQKFSTVHHYFSCESITLKIISTLKPNWGALATFPFISSLYN